MKKLFLLLFLSLLIVSPVYSAEPKADKIRTSVTNFNNNLSSADTNVQKALDTIDNFTLGGSVSDTAYGVSWDGVTTIAPSKNAVYDKIETLGAASGDITSVGDGLTGAVLDGSATGGTWIKFYDAQGAGQLITGNLTGARVWTLPDETGTLLITETDPLSATKALNNLASVAINTSLLSDTAATDDLGTEAIFWKKLYLGSDISFEGATDDTYQTTLTAVDTTLSDKSINIPNASGTMAVSATAPATVSVLGDIGVTVLKDLVTTAPLTGGANDILVGADTDITIAMPQATTSADGYVVQADWDSWTDHVADNTQAHSDYVINSGDTITGALTINDNNAAGSTLLTIGDATDADSVAIFGDLTVTGGDITLGTSAIFSGGDTTSLNLIDAIDATTETTLETALDIGGEVTSTGMASTVIADSVAVTSWNLTTPTITTSLTTSTPTTLTVAELDRLDGLTSAIIDDDKIDTSAELLAILGDETGTGVLVFNDSPTFADNIQLGLNGADGQLIFWAEQATDRLATLNPNAAMASNADFYLPADEPAATSFINMTTGGVMGFIAPNAGTDITADLEEEVTEGSLADSVILSADIKNGEIVSADLSGTAGITLAQTAMTAGRSLTIATNDVGADVELYTYTITKTIENPSAADDNIPIFFPPYAITITNVYGMTEGGTSCGVTISDGTNALEEIVFDTDGQADDGTLTNNTFTANEEMQIDTGTVTGTVTWVTFTITYTVDD